jgi:hypothetical protein
MTVYEAKRCRHCGGGNFVKRKGRWYCTAGCDADLVLPGWSCTVCGVFNGEVKEPRATCRGCDEPKHRPNTVPPEPPSGPMVAGD